MTFEEVVERYEGLIVRVVNKYSSKLNTKEDLYQECLTKMWSVFNEYNGEYSWATFIHNICSNHLRNIVKQETTLKRVNHTSDNIMIKDIRIDNTLYTPLLETLTEEPPEQLSEEEELMLDRAYEILENEKHKDKIELILNGMTYREVGETFNVSKQYIEQIYKKFIKKVKE